MKSSEYTMTTASVATDSAGCGSSAIAATASAATAHSARLSRGKRWPPKCHMNMQKQLTYRTIQAVIQRDQASVEANGHGKVLTTVLLANTSQAMALSAYQP
ncbi:hypothetical protein D9M69_624580 [compost metagenome]